MKDYAKTYFSKHWSQETSYVDGWNQDNPGLGHCAVSSLAVQELMGGDIAKIILGDGQSHYFNVIDGNVYDITEEQFDHPLTYLEHDVVSRSKLLSNSDTASRYSIFHKRLLEEISRPLPIEEIEHISIRDPNYVAGTAEKPEVKVFCQTNKKHHPISDNKFHPGQNVYMKWTSGPIVAKSKLVSWHSGVFHNGNINQLRELTVGSNLFGLTDYWEVVSKKQNGFYSVMHLAEEKWMDALLYPSVRSHGSSWVYLDTAKKKIQWLSVDHEPSREKQKGRSIPASMRFLVLKRDVFTCQYCGRSAPEVKLHIDHKVPWSKVKQHEIDNLVAACSDCNLGKSDKEL